MRWQEISVGRRDPKSPIQSREISPTRAGSREGSGEALFVDCTAQQCPGEQQNCWPRPCRQLPKPRCPRSRRRNLEEAQLSTPFSARCFPVGGRDLTGSLTILVVEGSQSNKRASAGCCITSCALRECFLPVP